MKRFKKIFVCLIFILLCFSLYACSSSTKSHSSKDTWIIEEGKDKFGEKNENKFIVTSNLLSGSHSSSIANNEKAKFLIAYYPDNDRLTIWPYDEYGNKAIELSLAETWRAIIKSGNEKTENFVTLTTDQSGIIFHNANSNGVLKAMLKSDKAQILIEGFTEYAIGYDWLTNEFDTKSFEKCFNDLKQK